MSKEEFTKYYCENSNISKEDLLKSQVVLKCKCGDESCKGWAVVSNNQYAIKAHNKFYK